MKNQSEEIDLLNDAFHDVKLITTNNDLLPFVKIPKSLEFRLYPGTSATVKIPSGIGIIISRNDEHVTGDSLSIDTHWTVHDGSNVALHVNSSCSRFVSTYSYASGDEVPRVRVCLSRKSVSRIDDCKKIHKPGNTRDSRQACHRVFLFCLRIRRSL